MQKGLIIQAFFLSFISMVPLAKHFERCRPQLEGVLPLPTPGIHRKIGNWRSQS